MTVDHEFGGQHTELKLSVVESYLIAYTKALRHQFDHLWYIDAFAGTGTRIVRTVSDRDSLFEPSAREKVEVRRGSAMIALDVQPHFDRLVFMEQNPAYCNALRALSDLYPGRDITVVEGDANEAIQSEIKWKGWRSTRAVLFLDPYGMEVEWATLEAIASTKAIDVWFLFPLAGLYRQATRQSINIDEPKRRALTRMFGSGAWENELYSKEEATDLFGTTYGKTRLADVAGLEQYVKNRLETIFSKVLKPLALPLYTKPQRFSLFLCISNDEPKAIGLATRIGNSILKARTEPAFHRKSGR